MSRVTVAMGFALIQAAVPPLAAQRLIGRVFDQSRRVVEGVQVIVNGGELRATSDSAGIFRVDLAASDSVIGFRRIGFEPLFVAVYPLPPADDTVLVQLRAAPIQLA